uniref:Uncharacterized protein n=1 Tax=Glossina austeni TaxID=7395 RepID=A0A1A9VR89_GLOAU
MHTFQVFVKVGGFLIGVTCYVKDIASNRTDKGVIFVAIQRNSSCKQLTLQLTELKAEITFPEKWYSNILTTLHGVYLIYYNLCPLYFNVYLATRFLRSIRAVCMRKCNRDSREKQNAPRNNKHNAILSASYERCVLVFFSSFNLRSII